MNQKHDLIKTWGAQIRGNFLILSVLLTVIGLSLSAWQLINSATGSFNPLHAGLLILGVVLAHISVNLFNEYSDYKTKIDFHTKRTPFSGGSGMIQSGMIKPESVLTTAIITLLMALAIGIYFFVISHWILIFFVAAGGIAVVFYTDYLAKWLIGEFFAGLTLGTLVVLGTYIAMTGNWNMSVNQVLPLEVILVSLPPGILTFLLLLLNEFPDTEADRKGGRFHLVIWLGKKKAACLYASGLFLVYLIIIILPVLDLTPWWILLALATSPLAIKSGIIAIKHGEDNQKLLPALSLNVIVVLGTDGLIAISFLIILL